MRKWIGAAVVGLLLLSRTVAAQTGMPVTVQAIDPTGTTVSRVGDATNNSIRLTCIVCPVTQSGIWTVQPGNTANTTAWLVTGTGGTFPVTGTFWQATQPVSLASVPSHAVTNAGTFAVQAAQSGTWTVTGAGGTFPVTGTFWQATQPVSGPLTDTQLRATAVPVDGSGVTQPVSGTVTANLGTIGSVATAAKQDTGNTSLSSIDGKITAVNTGAVVVSSSALPSGAATAAKQPALGTAGTASADVITVQGIASMTAIKTDGSATTQPISAASLPLPSTAATSTKQSDGTQKTQVVDGSGNVIGATSNALDINIKSGNPTTITVTQGTATNLKTQAEAYQGGSAVASGNPLQVTLANGSVPSHAVTNAGTFAVQAAQSGTWSVNTKTALTANAPTAASVGVSSAQALASNSSRKGLVLVNTSSNTISFACGQTAVLSSGITLYPGGSYTMTEYDYCTGAINAIASGATSNLAIQEYQ